jgi:hypothetical protein
MEEKFRTASLDRFFIVGCCSRPIRMLSDPFSPRLLKKVQMQGGK